MKKFIIFMFMFLFIGCKNKENDKNNSLEKQQNYINTVLTPYKEALEFKQVKWGGSYTMNRQKFLKNHPNQIFYTTIKRRHISDIAYFGDKLIFNFDDYDNNIFYLEILQSQISALDANHFSYLVIFTIDKINQPKLSLTSEIEDKSEDSMTSNIVLDDINPKIIKGTIIQIKPLP